MTWRVIVINAVMNGMKFAPWFIEEKRATLPFIAGGCATTGLGVVWPRLYIGLAGLGRCHLSSPW